jgi:hypothetical protein
MIRFANAEEAEDSEPYDVPDRLDISSKRRHQSYDPRTRATACNAAVKSCLVRAPIE